MGYGQGWAWDGVLKWHPYVDGVRGDAMMTNTFHAHHPDMQACLILSSASVDPSPEGPAPDSGCSLHTCAVCVAGGKARRSA